MTNHVTTEGGRGWLRTCRSGDCAAHYLMVARRLLDGPGAVTDISGVLRAEIDTIILAALAGGAMLQLADGRLYPIEIVRAQAASAVFAVSAGPPVL